MSRVTMLGRRTLLAAAASTGLLSCTGHAPGAMNDSKQRRLLLDALVDTIIPATDTPGAREAKVTDFIEKMLDTWLTSEERERFLAGLGRFDDTVRKATGKSFAHLSPADRLRTLESMARAEAAVEGPSTAGPFIAQLRALTVNGYYTSEIGASQELELNLVPGTYEHCHTISPDEHAPSLGRTNAVLRLP